ncbi:hypothetical protein PCCS19_50010 [Paenibacillus sp. CCS19]|uniref:hypothetical protein n=1 Tax=Paenibacillus sp. CCS19 TaxID=3158387 RepID=UPI00256A569D|nr:hypothetical protein [Paenibacillus cellulosilyticus]GMK41942.1 hypothetical protein PCCS19_50010 [Paenibacillus cellulosilyticus]
MSVSVHFCLARLEDQITLIPAISWDADELKQAMVVIRSADRLEDWFVQIGLDNDILWSSRMRPAPSEGIIHPFTHEDDSKLLYISEKLLNREDLVMQSNYYDVVIISQDNQIFSIPLLVEWVGPEETEPMDESSTDDYDAEAPLESILGDGEEEASLPATVQFESTGAVQESAYEESIQPESETQAEVDKNEDEPTTDHESPDHAVEDKEEEAEPSFSKERLGQFLSEVFSIDQSHIIAGAKIERSFASLFQIVVEKVGSSYITVLNDVMVRPMYFMINGESIHQWEGGVTSYFDWLEGQIVKMLNISQAEYDQWQKLYIVEADEEPSPEELPRVTIITRQSALLKLQSVYPVLFDVTNTGVRVQLTFVEEDKQISVRAAGPMVSGVLQGCSYLTVTAEQEVEIAIRINGMLENWFSPFGRVRIMMTGFGAIESIRKRLTGQFEYEGSYPNTNLAWELACLTRNSK